MLIANVMSYTNQAFRLPSGDLSRSQLVRAAQPVAIARPSALGRMASSLSQKLAGVVAMIDAPDLDLDYARWPTSKR